MNVKNVILIIDPIEKAKESIQIGLQMINRRKYDLHLVHVVQNSIFCPRFRLPGKRSRISEIGAGKYAKILLRLLECKAIVGKSEASLKVSLHISCGNNVNQIINRLASRLYPDVILIPNHPLRSRLSYTNHSPKDLARLTNCNVLAERKGTITLYKCSHSGIESVISAIQGPLQ